MPTPQLVERLVTQLHFGGGHDDEPTNTSTLIRSPTSTVCSAAALTPSTALNASTGTAFNSVWSSGAC